MSFQGRRKTIMHSFLRPLLLTGSSDWIMRCGSYLLVVMACDLPPALAQAQTLTTLYSFSGGSDGGHPYGSLIADGSGALYSTTFEDLGTVFKLTPPPPTGGPWTKSVLHSFTGNPDGQAPFSALIADASGTLYGTTPGGGTTPAGTVYKGQPPAALTADPSGALYGPAPYGGASGNGVVFKLTPPTATGGAWTETVLYSFSGGTDGTSPNGSLIADASGALYGTTTSGGTGSSGTVFKLTPPTTTGGAWTETVLYTFTGSPDGASPFVGLIADASGALYGATYNGGTSGNGTVFKLTPPTTTGGAWTETVLYSFSGSDGANPRGSLIADAEGAHYGTTFLGGAGSSGTVFKLTPPATTGGAWTETVLYSFTGGSDGANPPAALIADTSGALYGTTNSGGGGYGTVFKLTLPARFTGVPGKANCHGQSISVLAKTYGGVAAARYGAWIR